MIDINWVYGKFDDFEDETVKGIKAVRKVVFCDEQGYSAQEEFDKLDDVSCHILLTDSENQDKPLGTGRLYFEKESEAHLGRIAVLKEYRGRNLGELIMVEMEKKAVELDAKRLLLSAQCRASGFYEKTGFSKLGERYMDGHVEHIMMEKKPIL